MLALGLTLIALALVLALAEAHLSTGGLIGAGAGLAVVAGVVVLLVAGGAGAALILIVGLCAAMAAALLLVVARRRLFKPLRVRPRTGREALVGHTGVVRSSEDGWAEVFVDGSLWRAEPSPLHHEEQLHSGEHVIVEDISGLTLRVRRAEQWELSR